MESNELKKKNIQTSREEIDYGSVNLRKVAVIGCGFVGSASAFALMQSGMFSEMVLIDASKELSGGKKYISNRAFRNWNTSIYRYDRKTKSYKLKNNINVSKDIPRRIKW